MDGAGGDILFNMDKFIPFSFLCNSQKEVKEKVSESSSAERGVYNFLDGHKGTKSGTLVYVQSFSGSKYCI
jgi:hypothetical protein